MTEPRSAWSRPRGLQGQTLSGRGGGMLGNPDSGRAHMAGEEQHGKVEFNENNAIRINRTTRSALPPLRQMKRLLDNPLASSAKTLGAGVMSFSVSPWALFWFLYCFLPCLGLHLVHCKQPQASAAGGQGLWPRSPSCLHGSAQAKRLLMQCLCNRTEVCFPGRAKGSCCTVERALERRASHTCLVSYFL